LAYYALSLSLQDYLQIKMGGKNMTFSQRIEAKRQGDCDSPP
jgi:hypothetical protein